MLLNVGLKRIPDAKQICKKQISARLCGLNQIPHEKQSEKTKLQRVVDRIKLFSPLRKTFFQLIWLHFFARPLNVAVMFFLCSGENKNFN